MIALLAALAAVASPPDELSAAIDAAVRPLAARVAALEEGLAALQKENALLKARAPVQRSISVAGGDDEAGAGRRLSSDPNGCCRWDAAGSCTGVASARMYKCTSLHEYLEDKVVTHTFTDIDTCMGDTDTSTWAWAFSGPTGNVTLSNSGTGAVSTFPTPLQVTHASSCGETAPTLALQMDTEVTHDLDVKGSLTVNGYAVPPAGPSTDGEPYDSTRVHSGHGHLPDRRHVEDHHPQPDQLGRRDLHRNARH